MSDSIIEKILENDSDYSSKKMKKNKNIENHMEKMRKLINLIYGYLPKLEKQPDLLGETIHIVDIFYKDFYELYNEYKSMNNSIQDVVYQVRSLLKDFVYEACCLHEEYEKNYRMQNGKQNNKR